MPQTISVSNDTFANYIKVASLPRNERQTAFSKLSNEEKADFVKVQFAMHLVKRPNLSKEQRDFLLDSMLKVSADLYGRENAQKSARANEISQETENKAFGLFTQRDAFEILEGLGVNKNEDVALLQKYEDLLKLGMQQRKTVVSAMPIAERVAVWKTQLAYHLAASSFNKEQKEFIVEAMPNIQSIFEASSSLSKEDREKYAEALESRMFKVFTKAEAYAVFMTIGIQNKVRDDPEFLKQFNAGYKGQNFLPSQFARLDSSEIRKLSPDNKNKSPNF